MDALLNWIDSANDILWNTILLVMLCGPVFFYTLKLKFIQVRKFKEGLKIVFGSFSLSGKETGQRGNDALSRRWPLPIAAQVGTGNLTGAATALIGGGPGAIFWMWTVRLFRHGDDLRGGRTGAEIQNRGKRRSDRRVPILYPAGI